MYYFILQNNLRYEIIGLSSAPDYFAIDDRTGEIRIQKDLTSDPVKMPYYMVMLVIGYCLFHLVTISSIIL